MSQVFETQSLLSIILETEYAGLSSAGVKKILYTKPDGEDGDWDATVVGTTLKYDLANGDIDQSGVWSFQAYIEVGGLKGFGDIDQKTFKVPLSE